MDSKSVAIKREQRLLAQDLKNTRDRYKLEQDKLRAANQSELKNERYAHKVQLSNVKSDTNKKIESETLRKEKILRSLKDQVAQTKNQTRNELNRITEKGIQDLDISKTRLAAERNRVNLDHAMSTQDANEEFNSDMKGLNRKMQEERSRFKTSARTEKVVDEKEHKNKLHTQRRYFGTKIDQENSKYARTLSSQTNRHKNHLVGQERDFNTTIETRDKVNQMTLNNMADKSEKKISDRQKFFEQKYNALYNKHEKLTQALNKRKESIIKDLATEVFAKHKVNVERSDDEFYSFDKIHAEITPLEKEYEVIIPVPEHMAEYVQLAGYDREITISMNRRFNTDQVKDNGEKTSVDKIETYVSKIPVDKIVNQKAITKTYQDGALKFMVAYK